MLRSPVGLSYAVVSLLGACALSDLFMIGGALRLRSLLSGTPEGDPSVTWLEDTLTNVVTTVQGSVFLVTGVVFIVWFHRVRRNAGVFAPDLHRGGAGWAIGAWLIPIANIWLPRGVAADTWRASRRDPYGDGKEEPFTLLNLWWTFWILSVFAETLASGAGDDAAKSAKSADFEGAALAMTASAAVDLVAAALAILFVRRLTRMQRDKGAGGAVRGGWVTTG